MYVLVRDSPGIYKQSVGGAVIFFCASWGCETTGDVDWSPSSDWDLITVKRDRTGSVALERDSSKYPSSGCAFTNSPQGPCKRKWCNPLIIQFTEKGKAARTWTKGLRWGLRLLASGKDPGVIFQIRVTLTSPPTQSIGPNLVLTEPQSRPKISTARLVTPRPTALGPKLAPSPPLPSTLVSPPSNTEGRLLDLVEGAFLVLNRTNPNITQSCWLCFASNPPYYGGIAQDRNISKASNHAQCSWGNTQKLTLAAVSGRGLCIGQVPQDKKHLCSRTDTTNFQSDQYLVPPLDKPGLVTRVSPPVYTPLSLIRSETIVSWYN